MMSSLVPGSLFYTTGLNRKSTPTPTTATPDELDRLYGRPELDGNPWPYESPIHNMYDVRNTSTKMIILNNKYGKDRTRLRGYYTGPNIRKSERQTDPGRHSRVSSPRNLHHHEKCYHSGTPYFEPSIKADIEWTNQTERPPNSLTVRSAVNPKRHLHCVVPSATTIYTATAGDQSPRPVSRLSRSSLPPQRYYTEYADLTIGEKIYLWSIEKIYNIENLKRLKQEQYQKLLELETKKGQTVTWKDYDKYMRYIQSASSRTYGTRSPSPSHRARSAMSTRSESGRQSSAKMNKTPRDSRDTISRPRTTSSRARRSKTVEPISEKHKNLENEDKNYEGQIDSTKSEATMSSALKSVETTDKTTSKTDDEKLTKQPTKRPTSKTSQGQGQRPKSSASRSSKSLSPYATPLVSPSPYASRTSSAKSLHSSRPSSYKSTKSKPGSTKSSDRESTKEDHSQEKEAIRHKEGIDRPKSRLGHPSPVDKDAHYFSDQKSDISNDDSDFDFFSSKKALAYIKDKHKSDDSRVNSSDKETDFIPPMKSTEETQGQHNSDDSSVKSSDKEIDFISPKKTIEEIKDEHKLNDSIVKSVADHEEIQSQLNVVTEAEPRSNGRDKLEQKENEKEGNEESFKTEDEFKTEIFKDDVNYEPLDTAKENEKQLKAEGSDSDNDTNSVKVNEKEEMVTVGRTFRTVKETPKDEVEYTDLYSKWKKENEDAAKKATTENSSVENDAEGANEGNQKKDLDIVTSEEEDADRRPNRDLDKIEY